MGCKKISYIIVMVSVYISYFFGQNLILPSVLTKKLPVMKESINELLKRHLNTILESRKTFVECEANEKLQS